MPEDLRAVLEGIVYGDDPKITPADRLRAAEQLQGLDDDEWTGIKRILVRMEPDEVRGQWDAYCGAEAVEAALAGSSEYPRMAAAICAGIDERALAWARELADADRIEAEVERRAHELAEQLYQQRTFEAVSADPAPGTHATVAFESAATALAPAGIHPGLTLLRSWSDAQAD